MLQNYFWTCTIYIFASLYGNRWLICIMVLHVGQAGGDSRLWASGLSAKIRVCLHRSLLEDAPEFVLISPSLAVFIILKLL